MSVYTQISNLIHKIIESPRKYFNDHTGILLYLQGYHMNSLPTNLADVSRIVAMRAQVGIGRFYRFSILTSSEGVYKWMIHAIFRI
jgi:hypothetical protein